MIGNGICDNRDPYNTAACGFDRGDCDDFNEKYPGCKVFSNQIDWLGNGFCSDLVPFNTEACEYDGGDCIEYNKYPDWKPTHAYQIGDKYCDRSYNTSACGYDGGDCLFLINYYKCVS